MNTIKKLKNIKKLSLVEALGSSARLSAPLLSLKLGAQDAEGATSGDGNAKRFTVEFISPTDAGAAIAVRQGLLFDPAQPTSALKIGFAPKPDA